MVACRRHALDYSLPHVGRETRSLIRPQPVERDLQLFHGRRVIVARLGSDIRRYGIEAVNSSQRILTLGKSAGLQVLHCHANVVRLAAIWLTPGALKPDQKALNAPHNAVRNFQVWSLLRHGSSLARRDDDGVAFRLDPVLAIARCRTRSWPLHPFDGDGAVIGRATSCCPSLAKPTTRVASYDTGEIARRADTSCARYEAIADGERALEELQTQPPNL